MTTNRTNRPSRIAIARIEVLVIVTALALLIAALAPINEVFENPSRSADCLQNLHEIGQISALVAMADARMIPHRQSTTGQNGYLGLGSFDWGGADGFGGDFAPNCLIPNACMPASTRPYNAYVDPTRYADVYRCPSDIGNAPLPDTNYNQRDSLAERDYYRKCVFLASGNSYQGDFLWINAGGSSAARFGSFFRPAQAFPNPSETLLFTEARFPQAYLSSDETIAAGSFSTAQALDVQSWHGRQKHNVLFVDGHAQPIELHRSGSMIPVTNFPADFYTRTLLFRGPGWRYDAFPDEYVVEHATGDPLPQNLTTPANPGLKTSPERIP